jgi:hypothetical protein
MDDAIEAGINDVFEILRAELLEGSEFAVAGIIHDDVQAAERLNCGCDRSLSFVAVSYVVLDGANISSISLDEILQILQTTRRRDHTISRRKDSFGDVFSQAAGTSRDQPDLCHELNLPLSELSKSTIHKQFDSIDVRAIVGCQEQRDFGDILRLSDASQRHLRCYGRDQPCQRGWVLTGRSSESWSVDPTGTQHVHANPAVP